MALLQLALLIGMHAQILQGIRKLCSVWVRARPRVSVRVRVRVRVSVMVSEG